ncbi:MAG: response regulator transcription factor [Gorillibacterium sp.]|nr:response regulator transcription factor [Gorillibacterium sp.]
MTTILITDDDPHIRKLVKLFLLREGFEVLETADGVETLELLETVKADLVILDIMMPRMDGWQLCQELRQLYELPILMLTAKGDTSQIVKGFELGTDDYLVKPFEPAELIARVKALLKRYRISVSQKVQLGQAELDRETYRMTLNGESCALPRKEFELLFKLAGYPGKTFSRDQLIEDIWGYDFSGNERTLDVHINRLRERFPEDQHSFAIKTIRGLGYRLEVRS